MHDFADWQRKYAGPHLNPLEQLTAHEIETVADAVRAHYARLGERRLRELKFNHITLQVQQGTLQRLKPSHLELSRTHMIKFYRPTVKQGYIARGYPQEPTRQALQRFKETGARPARQAFAIVTEGARRHSYLLTYEFTEAFIREYGESIQQSHTDLK